MTAWILGLAYKHGVYVSLVVDFFFRRDLQKATCNFTTLIGQGAFGPVYKAQMSTGETVAVKVLATDSKQGEKEFQTEVNYICEMCFDDWSDLGFTKSLLLNPEVAIAKLLTLFIFFPGYVVGKVASPQPSELGRLLCRERPTHAYICLHE